MRILFSILPTFCSPKSNTFNVHLGIACITTYLKMHDKTLNIKTVDLRLAPDVDKFWGFMNPNTSFRDMFVIDICYLPILVSLIKKYRNNKNIFTLLETDNELIRRWSLERSLFPGLIIESLNKMNSFALKYVRMYEGADIAGFSLYETNMYLSFLMALLIRIYYPKIKIVFGGPQVTQSETTRQLLLKGGIADFVVIGEGEQPMLDAINAIRAGESLNNITGIKTLENLELPDTFSQNANIEELPLPDYGDINFVTSRLPVIPIYSNRGCTFRCNFCSEHSLFGKRFKQRSPQKVVNDMEELSKRYNFFNFHFADSLLNSSEKWLEEFCDLIIVSGKSYKWGCYLRATLSENLVKKMRKAGLTLTSLGVESFSQNALDKMNKKKIDTKIIDSINYLIENDVVVYANLIIGYPGETEEDFLTTMDVANSFYEKAQKLNKSGNFSISPQVFRIKPFSNDYDCYKSMGIEVKSWAEYYSDEYYADDLKEIFEKTLCTFTIRDIPIHEISHRNYVLKLLAGKYGAEGDFYGQVFN